MSQLDQSTLAWLCLLAFVILAPLSVCGVFAVCERYHQRRARRKSTMRSLRLLARR